VVFILLLLVSKNFGLFLCTHRLVWLVVPVVFRREESDQKYIMKNINFIVLLLTLTFVSCTFFESRDGKPSPAAQVVSATANGFLQGGPIGAIVGGVGSLLAAVGGAYGLKKRSQAKTATATLDDVIHSIENVRAQIGKTNIDPILSAHMKLNSKAVIKNRKQQLKI